VRIFAADGYKAVMRAFVGVLTVCVAALLPATADAATWKGKTRQGRAVVVRTGSDGVVNRLRIGWKAHCANGAYKSRTLFAAPLDSATATSFTDAGDYRGHPEGYRSRIWVRVAGTLDDDVWRGTFRVSVRVSKNGDVVDTCRLKRLRWRASPVS
jgi:hypothetical protein